MQTIRRLYIYLMMAVSLGLAAFGLMTLLEVGIDQIWQSFGGRELLGIDSDEVRQRLSLALPFVLIAGPIWWLHWRLASRAVSTSTPEDDERQSWVRAAYFVGVAMVALFATLPTLIFLGRSTVEWTVGAADSSMAGDVPVFIARLVVAIGIWGLHVWFQRRDAGEVRLTGVASWLPRFYTYGAAVIGMFSLFIGVSLFAELVGQWILNVPPDRPGEVWWHGPLGDSVGAILPGLLIWGSHWWFITRLVNREAPEMAAERPARIRLVYLVSLIMLGVFFTTQWLINGVEVIARELVNYPQAPGISESIRLAIVGVVVSLPFIAVWIAHRNFLLTDGRLRNGTGRFLARAVRLENYGAALVALFVLALGAAALTGLLFDAAFDGTRTTGFNEDDFRRDVAENGTVVVIGAAFWIYQWLRVRTRMAVQEPQERPSLERRLYLYVVLGVAGVGLLVTTAFIVYRLMERLLGVGETGAEFISELSTSVGFLAVAVAIVVYNGQLLLRDMPLAPAKAVEVEERPVETMAVPLRMTVPVDSEIDPILDDLRDRLPAGFTIDRMDQPAITEDEPRPAVDLSRPIEAT